MEIKLKVNIPYYYLRNSLTAYKLKPLDPIEALVVNLIYFAQKDNPQIRKDLPLVACLKQYCNIDYKISIFFQKVLKKLIDNSVVKCDDDNWLEDWSNVMVGNFTLSREIFNLTANQEFKIFDSSNKNTIGYHCYYPGWTNDDLNFEIYVSKEHHDFVSKFLNKNHKGDNFNADEIQNAFQQAVPQKGNEAEIRSFSNNACYQFFNENEVIDDYKVGDIHCDEVAPCFVSKELRFHFDQDYFHPLDALSTTCVEKMVYGLNYPQDVQASFLAKYGVSDKMQNLPLLQSVNHIPFDQLHKVLATNAKLNEWLVGINITDTTHQDIYHSDYYQNLQKIFNSLAIFQNQLVQIGKQPKVLTFVAQNQKKTIDYEQLVYLPLDTTALQENLTLFIKNQFPYYRFSNIPLLDALLIKIINDSLQNHTTKITINKSLLKAYIQEKYYEKDPEWQPHFLNLLRLSNSTRDPLLQYFLQKDKTKRNFLQDVKQTEQQIKAELEATKNIQILELIQTMFENYAIDYGKLDNVFYFGKLSSYEQEFYDAKNFLAKLNQTELKKIYEIDNAVNKLEKYIKSPNFIIQKSQLFNKPFKDHMQLKLLELNKSKAEPVVRKIYELALTIRTKLEKFVATKNNLKEVQNFAKELKKINLPEDKKKILLAAKDLSNKYVHLNEEFEAVVKNNQYQELLAILDNMEKTNAAITSIIK